MNSDTVVRARIDKDTKAQAMTALQAMGLSMSDVFRLILVRVANEKRLAFPIQVPHPATTKALRELEEGKGLRFDNTEGLFQDLDV